MKLKVTVPGSDRRKIERETEKLIKALGLSNDTFANMAARSVRDTVARNVQPFGMGPKAKKKGMSAVKKDLRNIFKVVPDAARGRQGVITSIAGADSFHQSKRGSRGRTRKLVLKKMIIRSIWNSYSEKVSEKVGMAKGSVLGGAPTQLKTKFQGWVKNWKNTGSSSTKKKFLGKMWIFKADPRHVASDRVMGERGIKKVMKVKDRNLKNLLRRKMRADLKKAQKKINR